MRTPSESFRAKSGANLGDLAVRAVVHAGDTKHITARIPLVNPAKTRSRFMAFVLLSATGSVAGKPAARACNRCYPLCSLERKNDSSMENSGHGVRQDQGIEIDL